MRKATKIWLVIAAVLVIAGLVMFASVMSAYRWDFTKLSTASYETNIYEISDAFSDISMNTDTADILFAASDDGTCRVVCYERENERHNAVVRDGTLTISVTEGREWYEYIGITTGTPKITVYLPEAEYGVLTITEDTGDIELPEYLRFESIALSVSTGDVVCRASASEGIKISTSTGDICAENLSAGSLDLSVSTGEVDVSDVSCGGDVTVRVSTGKAHLTRLVCRNITSTGSTGDISLKNTTAAGTLSVVRSTGNVTLEASDAAELFIQTDTGDVRGTLLTDKMFITETDTGRIDVPKTTSGGKCEIRTNTGDIQIEIK